MLSHLLPWQHAGEKLVCTGLLCCQLTGPLLHHLLQVICIFLQLFHHIVQYICMTTVQKIMLTLVKVFMFSGLMVSLQDISKYLRLSENKEILIHFLIIFGADPGIHSPGKGSLFYDNKLSGCCFKDYDLEAQMKHKKNNFLTVFLVRQKKCERPDLSGLVSLSCLLIDPNGGRWSGFSLQQALSRELNFSSHSCSHSTGRRGSPWKGVLNCMIISGGNM